MPTTTQTPAPPAHDALSQTLALLHPWIDFVPRQQRRLGLFVCLAIAIHLAAFFFIRIDATRAELINPPRTHVTVESLHPAAQAEGTGAFLDSLTDPRSFLLPVVPLARLAEQGSAPSITEINAQLDSSPAPPPAATQTFPLAPEVAPSLQEQVAADMRPARQGFSYDEAIPPSPKTTTWQWDPALGSRRPLTAPQLPSPVSDADLSPTELRVAIDAGGNVDHVLLEQTCQKPELDQQAVLAARKLRFAPVDQPGEVWARITVFWHATAQPQEVVEPTPPTPPGP